MSSIPTLHNIISARKIVYRFLNPTPLHHYATLSELIGAQVYIKHENHQPVGAFKVRGGLVMAADLTSEQRKSGPTTVRASPLQPERMESRPLSPYQRAPILAK